MLREKRQAFWDQVRAGNWAKEAAEAIGVSGEQGRRLFAECGGVMEPRSTVSGRYLSNAEREEIAILHGLGHGVREIGRQIGRPHTTVARELSRNSNRDGGYRALAAQRRAEERARRPKPGKLALNPALREFVVGKLASEQWSPRQISQALRMEFGDDESMRCCHETIYRSIYVQGRGELKRELAAHLRTRRTARKPQHRSPGRRIVSDPSRYSLAQIVVPRTLGILCGATQRGDECCFRRSFRRQPFGTNRAPFGQRPLPCRSMCRRRPTVGKTDRQIDRTILVARDHNRDHHLCAVRRETRLPAPAHRADRSRERRNIVFGH